MFVQILVLSFMPCHALVLYLIMFCRNIAFGFSTSLPLVDS